MADEWQSQLSHTHALGAGSPTPHSPSSTALPRQGAGSTLPSAAITGKRQAQLSRVPHPVRGRASSAQPLDMHVVLGSCSNQGHPHGHRHCYYVATDSGVALSSSSSGWHLSMVAEGGTAHSPPVRPRVSSSISLHRAQAAPLLFLTHLSTVTLIIFKSYF